MSSGNFDKIRAAWPMGQVMTSHDLIKRTGLAGKTVFNIISHLCRRGEVERVGPQDEIGRGGAKYKRIKLPSSILAEMQLYSYNPKILPAWMIPKLPRVKIRQIVKVSYE